MRHFLTFETGDGDVTLDVSAICSSKDTTIRDARCTKDFKSAASSASFTIGYTPDKVLDPYDGTLIDRQALYAQAVELLLGCIESRTGTRVTILNDTRDAIVFNGMVDLSDVNLTRGRLPGKVSIPCRDYTTDLDKRIGFNLVYEDMTVNAVIDDLFAHAYSDGSHGFVGTGVDGVQMATGQRTVISSIPDTVMISPMALTEDDEDTYRSVIDTILLEKGGYVLHYIHSANRFELVKAIPDEVDDSAIRTVRYMVAEKVTTRTGVYDHDGILLKWPTVETKAGENVYSEDIELRYDASYGVLGRMLGNGSYFPEDGDVTETRQEYGKADRPYATGASRKENDDLELLYAKNAELGMIAEAVKCTVGASVADMDALEAIEDQSLGEYHLVRDLGEYRVWDGSAWIWSDTPSLGSDGKGDVYVCAGEVSTKSQLPSTAAEGHWYRCTDTGYDWCRMDGEWQRKISLLLFPVLRTADVDMVDGNPAFYPRSMWALGRNRSGGLVNLKALSVTATSVARTKVNKTTNPATLKDPEEYEARHIQDRTEAEAFALNLYNSHRIACTTCTWTEYDGQRTPLSTLGERVRVEFLPGTYAVFCVIQTDDSAMTRLARRRKVTALLVSGFESAFEGKHYSTVQASADGSRKVVGSREYYAVSDSGTIVPTSWSETRVVEQGRYLWTRTVTSYSDSSEESTYSVTFVGKDGEKGDKGESFTVVIESDNGSSMRFSEEFEVNLSAHVYINLDDITDELEAYRFTWRRISQDAEGDAEWNDGSKAHGRKSVKITNADVYGRSVFVCEIDFDDFNYTGEN